MRFLLLLGWFLLSCSPLWARPEREDKKLVVFIVVDQMQQNHLSYFWEDFLPPDKGGFRLLAERGMEHTRALLDHYPAHTAAGHATLATGALPSVHGVVGNRWLHSGERFAREAGSDPNYPLLEGRSSGFSPVTLMAPTLGDVFRRATGGASKVATVSLKNRVATLCAGHNAEAALWFDMDSGNWVTSRYFAPHGTLPEYVKKWNSQHHPDDQFPLVWEPRFYSAENSPRNLRGEQLRDGYAGEYMDFGDRFPHRLDGGKKRPGKRYYTAWSHTPEGVKASFELALQTVEHHQMGRDENPDLLYVGISALDKIGHIFGPDAPESYEILREIDLQLADFLARLDRLVGLDNCLLVLTSDHGSQPLVEYLSELGTASGVLPLADFKSRLQKRLERRWSPEQFLVVFSDPYVWLRPSPGFEDQRQSMLAELKDEIEGLEGIHAVLESDALMRGEYRPGTYEEVVARSLYRGRSGDLIVVPRPHSWVGFRNPGGTNHGTPWNYDRHVPLLLYGWPGVKGEEARTCAPRQVVSSLCHYFGWSAPAGCDAPLLPWLEP